MAVPPGLIAAAVKAAPTLLGTAGPSAGFTPKALVAEYGKPAASYVPDKFERMYRKQVLAQARALAAQGGAFTPGEREQAIAGGVGLVDTAGEQRRAQLARQSGAAGAGQRGIAQAAQRQLTKDLLAARGQVASSVRDVDVREYAKEIQKSQADLLQASAMERKRRDQALKMHEAEAEESAFTAAQLKESGITDEQIEALSAIT